MTQLVWFRNDLRLTDNPALTAALAHGEALEACYLITPEQWAEHDWAPAKTELLLRSLQSLAEDLARLGIPFHILSLSRFRDSSDALATLCRERGLSHVHANEEYAVNERHRDSQVLARLRQHRRALKIHRDQTVVPVDRLLTGQHQAYSVFTPYSRRWWQWLGEHPVTLLPRPKAQSKPYTPAEVPTLTDWRSSLANWLEAGETGAHRALEAFIESRIHRYGEARDFPAQSTTSVLSPYLALGILSPRQCLVAAREAMNDSASAESARAWVNELAWRDFYIQILYHYPRVSRHQPFRSETQALPWQPTGQAFERWATGDTGIPLVDAAMRQLNTTGWMHNRLRMVAAMFLSKNLFIDWREGERYFMQRLVDGYLPSNNGGWQWSASTGTDAAPYFRIFNPVTQSERFDPDGAFIRQYVPEIAHLKGKALFNPDGRVSGYPSPMVDLKASRKEAIARFQALRN